MFGMTKILSMSFAAFLAGLTVPKDLIKVSVCSQPFLSISRGYLMNLMCFESNLDFYLKCQYGTNLVQRWPLDF